MCCIFRIGSQPIDRPFAFTSKFPIFGVSNEDKHLTNDERTKIDREADV